MDFRRDYPSETRNEDSPVSTNNQHSSVQNLHSRRLSLNGSDASRSIGHRPPLTSRRTTEAQHSLVGPAAMGTSVPVKGTVTSDTSTDPRKRTNTSARSRPNILGTSPSTIDPLESVPAPDQKQDTPFNQAVPSQVQTATAVQSGSTAKNGPAPTSNQDRIEKVVTLLLKFADDAAGAALLQQRQRILEDDTVRATQADERNRRDFKGHLVLIEQGAEERRRAETRLVSSKGEANVALETQKDSALKIAILIDQLSDDSSRTLPTKGELKLQDEKLEQILRMVTQHNERLLQHDEKLEQLHSKHSSQDLKFSEIELLSHSTQEICRGLVGRMNTAEIEAKGLVEKSTTVQRLIKDTARHDELLEKNKNSLEKVKLSQNQLQKSLTKPSTEGSISLADFKALLEEVRLLRSQVQSQKEETARLKENTKAREDTEEKFRSAMQDLKAYRSEVKMLPLKVSVLEDATSKAVADIVQVNDEFKKSELAITEIRLGNTERDDVVANELDLLSADLKKSKESHAALSSKFEGHIQTMTTSLQHVIDRGNETAARLALNTPSAGKPNSDDVTKVIQEIARVRQQLSEMSDRLKDLDEREVGSRHSIRSLNTRFNNLTTQQMIDAIIQRLNQLYPHPSNVQREISKLKEDVANFERLCNEHRSSAVQVQVCTTAVATCSEKIVELENSRNENETRQSIFRREMIEARDKILNDLQDKEHSLQEINQNKQEFRERCDNLFEKVQEDVDKTKTSSTKTLAELSKRLEKLESITEVMIINPTPMLSKPESRIRGTSTPIQSAKKPKAGVRKNVDIPEDESYLDSWKGVPAKRIVSKARQAIDPHSEASDSPPPFRRGSIGELTGSPDISSLASAYSGKRKRPPPYQFDGHEKNDQSDDETYSERPSKTAPSRRSKAARKK